MVPAIALGIVVLPWLLYAQSVFGTIVPNTVVVKSGTEGILSFSYLSSSFRTLLQICLSTYLVEMILLATGGILYFSQTWNKVTPYQLHHMVPLLWMFALPGLYLYIQLKGGAPPTSRYLSPIFPVIVLYGFRGLEILLSFIQSRLGRNVRIEFGLILLVTMVTLVQSNIVSYLHYPFSRKNTVFVNLLVRQVDGCMTIPCPVKQ